jgi:hypothetical protein
MKMVGEVLEDAERRPVAASRFNFPDLAALEAIFGAALDTLPTVPSGVRSPRRDELAVIP